MATLPLATSTRPPASLNSKTSYTVTGGPDKFVPPTSTCFGPRFTVAPEGYDVVSLYKPSNTVMSGGYLLSRGYNPVCYPQNFGPGVVYSPAICPDYHTGALTRVNTYNTRTVTTVTCCPE
jgi:hypothetical protein